MKANFNQMTKEQEVKIAKMQRHYEFSLEIVSDVYLTLRCHVADRCSMHLLRFCPLDSCRLSENPTFVTDVYGEDSYGALVLLIS